jgi:predicted DNA-binding transcriptional regulator AlpA
MEITGMGKKLFRDDRSYRPDEVAEIWNMSIKSIYRMINDIDNPLPAFRPYGVGGCIRIKGNVLNKWTEKNQVNPLEE